VCITAAESGVMLQNCTFILFHECFSCCGFQPVKCIIINITQ